MKTQPKSKPGRKPLGRVKRLISLTPETLSELQRLAKARGCPVGYVIDGLVNPEGRSA